jgi:hypothetical protein
MARYGKTTRLSPKEVILRARDHFGPEGEVGLPIARESWNEVVFAGGGGSVAVTALPQAGAAGPTVVELLSREYDYWAERFLGTLPNA